MPHLRETGRFSISYTALTAPSRASIEEALFLELEKAELPILDKFLNPQANITFLSLAESLPH